MSSPLRRTHFCLFLVTFLLLCISLKTCPSKAVYRRIFPWRSINLSTSNPQSDKMDAETSTKSYDKTQGNKKIDEVSQNTSKLIKNNLFPSLNDKYKSIDD